MTTANQATLFLGFQRPNTTQIPDDVFDSLMPTLSGGEPKVLLYICRRTFGFTTKTGKVLDHGTGLCKRHVINALKSLEKKNIIITRTVDETGLNDVNTYSLNITAANHAEEPPVHQEVVNSSSPPIVNSSAPTKQREQKRRTKQRQ